MWNKIGAKIKDIASVLREAVEKPTQLLSVNQIRSNQSYRILKYFGQRTELLKENMLFWIHNINKLGI